MQNQKTRNGSLEKKSEVSPKTFGRALSLESSQKNSPRVVRQPKTIGLESDSLSSSSSSQAIRTPKKTSIPKTTERRSPKSPITEKKRPTRVSELNSHVSQLQNDLKTVKDQLILSESCKKQALKETEELANSGELAAAKNEIEQLKAQLKVIAESESTQYKQALSVNTELQSLKENMAETLSHMEEMKNQLEECKESESEAKALVGQTLLQLDTAKQTIEVLRVDDAISKESYDALAVELDQMRVKVNLLEGLVTKLKIENRNKENEVRESSEIEALEMAEIRYHEEQIQSMVQITSVYELLEDVKCKSNLREAELENELAKAKACIEELKANLMDKETELQGICEENEELNAKLRTSHSAQREFELEKELKKVKEDIKLLKGNMMDKETELQSISEENEILKLEVVKKGVGNGGKVTENNNNNNIVCQVEGLRVAEREALVKLGQVMEEAEKGQKRAERVVEQLEATQVLNSEMEAELRRLKVQSDQWRKAAEAAASMLSSGSNGKLVDRTCSLDSNYSPSTPYSEEMDDDFLKKKNGNVLRRIGILWKKQHK